MLWKLFEWSVHEAEVEREGAEVVVRCSVRGAEGLALGIVERV